MLTAGTHTVSYLIVGQGPLTQRTFPINKFQTNHRISERNNLIHLSSFDCWGAPGHLLGRGQPRPLDKDRRLSDCCCTASSVHSYFALALYRGASGTAVHCIAEVHWVQQWIADLDIGLGGLSWPGLYNLEDSQFGETP